MARRHPIQYPFLGQVSVNTLSVSATDVAGVPPGPSAGIRAAPPPFFPAFDEDLILGEREPASERAAEPAESRPAEQACREHSLPVGTAPATLPGSPHRLLHPLGSLASPPRTPLTVPCSPP